MQLDSSLCACMFSCVASKNTLVEHASCALFEVWKNVLLHGEESCIVVCISLSVYLCLCSPYECYVHVVEVWEFELTCGSVCVWGGCGVVCRFMCCMSQGALVKMSQYASAEITVVVVWHASDNGCANMLHMYQGIFNFTCMLCVFDFMRLVVHLAMLILSTMHLDCIC